MKKLKKLVLKEIISPLTKNEQGQLKGGFEEIDMKGGIMPRGSNVNCFPPNSSKKCDNGNCGGCSQCKY